MKIESVRVSAKSRRIGRTTVRRRGKKMVYYMAWTMEPMQTLVCYHSLDLEDELTKAFTAEILNSR